MIRVFLIRGVVLLWRNFCRGYTILRHPLLHARPALLLQYETATQHEAYRFLHFPVPPAPPGRRVLVIVPYRDRWQMTRGALESISAQHLGDSEMLVAMVDNGSIEASTAAGTAEFVRRSTSSLQFRHLRYDEPFNYSRLNNRAVVDCSDFAPNYLLFVNNDVDLRDRTTIDAMSAFLATHPSCGSVGCTLTFQNQRVQHLFIQLGCKIGGAHPFKGSRLRASDPWMQSPRPVGGCTAALLMVRISDFNAVGGFAEELANFAQDIDLALKLQQRGLANWTLPYLFAVHHETQSRSSIIHWDEMEWLSTKWREALIRNPFVSERYSQWSERLVLTLGEGTFPWRSIANRKR